MNESLRPLQPLPEQLYTGNSQLWPPCCFTLSPYHICVCQTKSVNSWTPYPLNEFSSPSNSPWSSPCSPKAMAWTKLSIMTALLFEPHSYPMYVRCAKPNRSNLESLLIHWMNESLSLSLSPWSSWSSSNNDRHHVLRASLMAHVCKMCRTKLANSWWAHQQDSHRPEISTKLGAANLPQHLHSLPSQRDLPLKSSVCNRKKTRT